MDFAELRSTGRIATPDDADWDAARRPGTSRRIRTRLRWRFAESADDVAEVVSASAPTTTCGCSARAPATARPLRRPRRHRRDQDRRMRGIEIDADARTARVEAGVLAAGARRGGAAEHGMCSMPGSSPDVGVDRLHARRRPQLAGRRYGFACNRVARSSVVTADGERHRDADNEPDLFWALRGGGGGYAIVTALHVDLLPPRRRLRRAPWSSRRRSAPTPFGPTGTGPRPSPTR